MTIWQSLLAVVFFGLGMYAVGEIAQWTVDWMDKVLLAYAFLPVFGFACGYCWCYARALRLTRKLFGDAWAEELKKAL